uniref:Uncharacterized protein n=1 Tax=Alexandrium monilatum TaxID=311494 RepID=A0A7S4VVN6_9DINO
MQRHAILKSLHANSEEELQACQRASREESDLVSSLSSSVEELRGELASQTRQTQLRERSASERLEELEERSRVRERSDGEKMRELEELIQLRVRAAGQKLEELEEQRQFSERTADKKLGELEERLQLAQASGQEARAQASATVAVLRERAGRWKQVRAELRQEVQALQAAAETSAMQRHRSAEAAEEVKMLREVVEEAALEGRRSSEAAQEASELEQQLRQEGAASASEVAALAEELQRTRERHAECLRRGEEEAAEVWEERRCHREEVAEHVAEQQAAAVRAGLEINQAQQRTAAALAAVKQEGLLAESWRTEEREAVVALGREEASLAAEARAALAAESEASQLKVVAASLRAEHAEGLRRSDEAALAAGQKTAELEAEAAQRREEDALEAAAAMSRITTELEHAKQGQAKERIHREEALLQASHEATCRLSEAEDHWCRGHAEEVEVCRNATAAAASELSEMVAEFERSRMRRADETARGQKESEEAVARTLALSAEVSDLQGAHADQAARWEESERRAQEMSGQLLAEMQRQQACRAEEMRQSRAMLAEAEASAARQGAEVQRRGDELAAQAVQQQAELEEFQQRLQAVVAEERHERSSLLTEVGQLRWAEKTAALAGAESLIAAREEAAGALCEVDQRWRGEFADEVGRQEAAREVEQHLRVELAAEVRSREAAGEAALGAAAKARTEVEELQRRHLAEAEHWRREMRAEFECKAEASGEFSRLRLAHEEAVKTLEAEAAQVEEAEHWRASCTEAQEHSEARATSLDAEAQRWRRRHAAEVACWKTALEMAAHHDIVARKSSTEMSQLASEAESLRLEYGEAAKRAEALEEEDVASDAERRAFAAEMSMKVHSWSALRERRDKLRRALVNVRQAIPNAQDAEALAQESRSLAVQLERLRAEAGTTPGEAAAQLRAAVGAWRQRKRRCMAIFDWMQEAHDQARDESSMGQLLEHYNVTTDEALGVSPPSDGALLGHGGVALGVGRKRGR